MNSNTRCSLPFARKLSRKDTRLVWCRVRTTSSSLAAVRLTCTNEAGCWQGKAATKWWGEISVQCKADGKGWPDLPSLHPWTP